MLNVNAKAFIPRSTDDYASHYYGSFFRYFLLLPVERLPMVNEEQMEESSVLQLLTKRQLYSCSLGGLGEEALRSFITTIFTAIRNDYRTSKKANAPTGILLSRTILSLSGTISSVCTAENAVGLLIRIDVPKGFSADVTLQLKVAWEDFFEACRNDSRLASLGYISSACGTTTARQYRGTYRHYFFVCSSLPQDDLDLLSLANFEFPFPTLRIVKVNALMPFICSPRPAVVVVVSVGVNAKRILLSEGTPDHIFSTSFFPFDVSRTFSSLQEFENQYLLFLQKSKWNKTHVLLVDIDFDDSYRVETSRIPLEDVLLFIMNLCDDTSTNIVGISFGDDTIENSLRLSTNTGGPNACYVNETLRHILERDHSLDTSSTLFGGFPQHLKRPLSSQTYVQMRRQVEKWLPYFCEPTCLNRVTFVAAAKSFAEVNYYARNWAVGTSVIMMTNGKGDTFCFDVQTSSLSFLSHRLKCATGPVANCAFLGTVVSSYRHYMDYNIVVEDVLCFEGTDVHNVSFPERWLLVEKAILDGYENRPCANHNCFGIMRANYLPVDKSERLVSKPPKNYPNLGVVLIPENKFNESSALPSYSWKPDKSVTAIFTIGSVENVTTTEEEICRAWLYVRDDSGQCVPYNHEYVDYFPDASQMIATGFLVECVLAMDSDGAHWWELVKSYHPNEGVVPNDYKYVDDVVHTSSITYNEVIWLASASNYKCERCQRIDDAGRVNQRNKAYWCPKCWEETGHGNCVYCGRSCTVGRVDSFGHHFYCDNCWLIFLTRNTKAEIGYIMPLPRDSSFATQVFTKCISTVIDGINSKAPTNDVLELCCGNGFARKWIRNRTLRYIGIDMAPDAVEATAATIATSNDEATDISRYDVICADAFSDDLWSQHLSKVHPRQFHVVTAFVGLHHAFCTEGNARRVIGRIANALVPGGVFVGCFLDCSVLFSMGVRTSDFLIVEWDADFIPKIGRHLLFSVQSKCPQRVNVITPDFLVAVAEEFGLTIIPSLCLTFREILENEHSCLKTNSRNENDYLCAMRTFTFKKKGTVQLCAKS
ncbi:hypothetical protein TRVL_08437 [Trypanosoma vivax]|nr:hypothetical protein TRVL_08437 [Trypanosoma vivax]